MAEKKRTKNSRRSKDLPDTSGKQLVIVESPAKARTINKYLGRDYFVMASVGHVRDLPTKNPKGVKDPVPGVDLDNDFRPTYQVIKGKGNTLTELKKAAKNASGIWLATDLDREGEAIAWHLAESLGVDPERANRVVFNAITKKEIEKAFKHPRSIDIAKVNAQQARRILDRIVGYQVSPLLWKKVAGGLSAGRVQSVAVRLVVERDREIDAFVPEEYWKVTGFFTSSMSDPSEIGDEWKQWLLHAPEKSNHKDGGTRTIREKNAWLADNDAVAAELIEIGGKRFEAKNSEEALEAAQGAGFELDEKIEKEYPKAKGPAQRVILLRGHVGSRGPKWRVKSIQTKRTESRPSAPFITSTLQQAAANQLGFSAQSTMRTAQSLYEGVLIDGMGSVGLITYMRTDSTYISPEAIDMARQYIGSELGDSYLPARPNFFASSNKTAQEAHEAIRPTEVSLIPDRIRSSLSDQQYKVYKIIWEKFVASQMTNAKWDSTTILISGGDDSKGPVFRATGRVLVFDGHYRVAGVPNSTSEPILPGLTEKQPLKLFHLDPLQHFTAPPPRYTEASLVKKLEAEGIGRPSTYAQIIQVIQNRQYVEKIQGRFYSTDLGQVVTDKLIEAFPEIMQVNYTSDMEQQLDDVEEKHADWVNMLKRFYGPFKHRLEAAYEGMGHAKAETQPAPYICPKCGGRTVYRFGKNGRFLSCSHYPTCKFAAPIDKEGNLVEPEQTDIACPKCGSVTVLRKGRFGSFLSCTKYPECDGIVNLDKKGCISSPKVSPLLTDLPCPKCGAPLNLRRGARGPWLSCSKFPKCRGRMGWVSLDDRTKKKWERALEAHEKAHPQPVILRVDGSLVSDSHRPRLLGTGEQPGE